MAHIEWYLDPWIVSPHQFFKKKSRPACASAFRSFQLAQHRVSFKYLKIICHILVEKQNKQAPKNSYPVSARLSSFDKGKLCCQITNCWVFLEYF